MGNSKYYTPTIDEFHIGFEYRVLDIEYSKYVNCIFQDGQSVQDLLDGDYGEVDVKYLDKEDVESLGFKYSYYEGDFYHYVLKTNVELMLGINYIDENFGATILIFNKEDEHEFDGIIKNKSELKKVLQMLNINIDGKN